MRRFSLFRYTIQCGDPSLRAELIARSVERWENGELSVCAGRAARGIAFFAAPVLILDRFS
jgi:hypothetical protein